MIGQSSCTAVDWAGVPVDERDRAVEGNHWPFLRSLSFTDNSLSLLYWLCLLWGYICQYGIVQFDWTVTLISGKVT